MSTLPITKLTSSTIYRPMDHDIFFNKSSSLIQLSQRPASVKKTISQFGQQNKKCKEEIRAENFRMIQKIMEIKRRPNKLKSQPPRYVFFRHENPERRRQIENENKRLGKSLLRIKLGKSLQRLKAQAAKGKSKRRQTEQDEAGYSNRDYNLFKMQTQEDEPRMRVSKLAKLNKLLEI